MKTKKIFVAAIAAVLLLTSLCGCGGKTEEKEEKEYIAVISAMDNEIDTLLKEAEIERTDNIAGADYYIGTLRGQPVVITKSGIGKVRAASVATSMFNEYKISKVIFTGIAGGVAEDSKVLDEVVATSLVEHDYGIRTNDGFIWRSGDPGVGDQPGEYYKCDPELVEIAYNAAVEAVGKENAVKGVIATGDQFVASEEYVKKLRADYDARACEMEGASVAVICINYGKPFVVIRCLSDMADGNAHDSYEDFGDKAAANSSRIVLKMLETLGEKAER